MVDKAREIALKILYKMEKENAYSNIVLNEEIKNNEKNLNSKDIGLISQIIYGTTSWKLTIDEIINNMLSDINYIKMHVYQNKEINWQTCIFLR